MPWPNSGVDMGALGHQKPAIAALTKHFRTRATAKFGERDIHPPTIVSASVSSGKSIILAEVAKAVRDAAIKRSKPSSVRIMIIQNQGLLCEQNASAGWDTNLNNSIFSASCKRKSAHVWRDESTGIPYSVVYGTIGTIARAIGEYKFSAYSENEMSMPSERRAALGKWYPDLIMIDEVHQVPFENSDSQYMKVLNHFWDMKPHLRLAGMTGSPFRGSSSIVGDSPEHLWKSVASIDPSDPDYPEGGVGTGVISTEFSADQGWILRPVFGYPDDMGDHYDFSHISEQDWSYPEAELDAAVSDKELCLRICADFIEKTKDRRGVLIFAATKRHTRQIAAALKLLGIDPEQIGVITENTPQKEQTRILNAAKAGRLKYVINVSVLTTGINCAEWDSLILMRPIASIVLLIQAIGRVLRLLIKDGEVPMLERDLLTAEERKQLIAASDKPDALVLDYAGCLDTLRDMYENPILEQAELEKAKKENLELIECPMCATMNSPHARRCIGGTAQERCEWFWSFRACPSCGTKNDQVARECRNQECRRLLVDPNANLSHKAYTDGESIPVRSMNIEAGRGGKLIITFGLSDGRFPQLIFWPHAGKQPMINSKIWGNFVKMLPIDDRSKYRLSAMKASTIMENLDLIPVPTEISARQNGKGLWSCGRMKFDLVEEVV